jgi:hypothetical protein
LIQIGRQLQQRNQSRRLRRKGFREVPGNPENPKSINSLKLGTCD